MSASYNRLCKLLIDKNMSKLQIVKEVRISTNGITH